MLKPTGFWSYSNSDDENSRGRLSQLRARLAAELQQQIGRNEKVNIFQDVAAIPPGVDWESQISDGLQASSFLIVILTPAFLQSEWCCREVGLFGKHETTLGRGDLIFPIHYIDIGDINPNNSSECFDKSIYELIHRHQLSDFRALRFKDPDSEEISRKIESVALAIRRALRHQRLAESKNDALPGSSESANPLDTSSKIKNIGRKNPMIENVKAFVSAPELNGYQSDRDKDKIVQRARAVSLLLSKSIAYLVWLVL